MSNQMDHLLDELALRAQRLAAHEGMTATALGCLQLFRSDHPTEITHSIYEPSVCIIAQGQKQARLGDETYVYNPLHYLVAAVDLPVRGQVIEATPEPPLSLHSSGCEAVTIPETITLTRSATLIVK